MSIKYSGICWYSMMAVHSGWISQRLIWILELHRLEVDCSSLFCYNKHNSREKYKEAF